MTATQPRPPINSTPISADVTIRRLTTADVPAGDVLFRAAFGVPDSRAADLYRYLALQPDGWLLALSGETPVGMVGAVDFGPFAYIGMLAVDPPAQGRGIGGALMRRLLVWLDSRGTPLSLLDASAAGAPIYLRLGFVENDRTSAYQLAAPADPIALPANVRGLGPADVAALAAFDALIFGADRTKVFRSLLAEFPGRAFVCHDETGDMAGYLFAQARRIGPWMARQPEAAEALLHAALTLRYESAPGVLTPQSNPAAAELLGRAGFQRKEFTRHMQRGGGPSPIHRELIYGLANYTLG